LRIELPVTKFLFLGLLIAAVTLASGPALGNDPISLGALGTGSGTYTSDEGPYRVVKQFEELKPDLPSDCAELP
jgi:hypothetical protein